MAQATFSVRMDENLKNQFDFLCNEFGMNMSTAINVFARAVVQQRRIPFDIVAPASEVTREGAMKAFMTLRTQAGKDFPEGMSMKEIDEEIRKTRYGEDE